MAQVNNIACNMSVSLLQVTYNEVWDMLGLGPFLNMAEHGRSQ